ncbi:MAG: GcrA family cell cycle regulator, partial [Microvirga sp.]
MRSVMASWTEKCVSQLKLLHEEGFSATVIAKKLGPDFTKGMVLGKLSRLALAEAPKPQEIRKASVQRVIPPKEIPARRLGPP